MQETLLSYPQIQAIVYDNTFNFNLGIYTQFPVLQGNSNRLFYSDGRQQSGVFNPRIYFYDQATKTTTSRSTNNYTLVYQAASFLYNNYVFKIGGYTTGTSDSQSSYFRIYDFTTGAALGSPPTSTPITALVTTAYCTVGSYGYYYNAKDSTFWKVLLTNSDPTQTVTVNKLSLPGDAIVASIFRMTAVSNYILMLDTQGNYYRLQLTPTLLVTKLGNLAMGTFLYSSYCFLFSYSGYVFFNASMNKTFDGIYYLNTTTNTFNKLNLPYDFVIKSNESSTLVVDNYLYVTYLTSVPRIDLNQLLKYIV